MQGKGKRRGNRSLDLSSSKLFYRELDELPRLSEEEESRVSVRTDSARMDILRAVTSVPAGRQRFLDPLRRLADGATVEEDLLDTEYWSVSGGVMRASRRPEFRALLRGISCDPPGEREALDMRLNWQRIEEIGEEVFSSTERLEDLRRGIESLLQRNGCDEAALVQAAVTFQSAAGVPAHAHRGKWIAYRDLLHLRREWELLGIETGVEPEVLLESAQVFRKARETLDSILETLVEANLRLVISVTRKFPMDSVMEEMDLIQEGCQGLLHAARRFDFHRGYRFSTYAVWWIRRYIATAVTRGRAQEGIPPHIQKKRAAVQEEIDIMASSRQRYPTTAEIARELDMPETHVDMIRAAEAGQLSIDRTWNGTDGPCLGDFLRADSDGPESSSLENELSRRIELALDALPQRERSVISLRFGLFDGEPQSLESVSRVFGVSRERIRQIQSSALARLRGMGIYGPVQQEDEKG